MCKREIKFRAWDTVQKKYLRINDVIIMQFTGLHDINKKEIYEGDIVENKFYNGHDHLKKFVAEIKYNNRDCCFYAIDNENKQMHPMSVFGPGCVVIGNIYENGDLLK